MIRFPDNETLNRREALKRGLLWAAGMAAIPGAGALAQSPVRQALSAPPASSPALKAKARAVIQIWMWGGPSHLDTFDPKPEAGYDFAGPLGHPIATNVDGIRIGELLPLLARQADKYSILRGMSHGNNSHETASYLVQTGHLPDRLSYPCIGAVVSRLRGYDAGYTNKIPPYVVLTQPQGRFSEAGFLGPRYKPFATGGDPNRTPFAVEGIVAQGITDARQRGRRDLLHELDTLGKAMPDDRHFRKADRCEAAGYDLILGDTAKLFDLSTEKTGLRDRYGRNTFGQSCLMARRLVEAGVPYVTINYNGWDTHSQHFEAMRRQLPALDAGMATLLADLADHGLLDSTIVWWGGEFGRTPRIQWEAPWNGGRGHYGQCFSAVVAGGGFKGGRIVGASDAKGQEVVDRLVSPSDLLATFYELLGIDPGAPMPNQRGLAIPIMPEIESVVPGTGRLHELV